MSGFRDRESPRGVPAFSGGRYPIEHICLEDTIGTCRPEDRSGVGTHHTG